MLLTWILRNWRLVALAVAATALLSAGIWFRGILADRAELTAQNEAQAQEVINLSGEIERMNRKDAADHALFETVEAQKLILAADIQKQAAALRRLRKELNDATQNCFDLTLPDVYLDGLPKTGN